LAARLHSLTLASPARTVARTTCSNFSYQSHSFRHHRASQITMESPRRERRPGAPFTLPSIATMTQGMSPPNSSPSQPPPNFDTRDSGNWSMSKRMYMSRCLHITFLRMSKMVLPSLVVSIFLQSVARSGYSLSNFGIGSLQ